jgi:hypothetical protein
MLAGLAALLLEIKQQICQLGNAAPTMPSWLRTYCTALCATS